MEPSRRRFPPTAGCYCCPFKRWVRSKCTLNCCGQRGTTWEAPALVELQDKCQRLESNLQEFVSVREQTRGTISLVFEAASANLQMINEQMLSFYLAKVFMISKEKFRFLER